MQIPIVHFNDAQDGEPPSASALATMPELDLAPVRAAQQYWAATPLRERLRVIKKFRHALAARSAELVRALQPSSETHAAEILSAQIIPLADACRFLEREAEKILRSQKPAGAAPLWLRDTSSEIHREPCGVVLVIAPSNYPIFLPGVVLVQALAAGNAVLLKPAPGCSAAVEVLLELVRAALPPSLNDFLPLPAGEGRGEGEQAANWNHGQENAETVMECGGKRSATPLLDAPEWSKAASPLRSAAALHDARSLVLRLDESSTAVHQALAAGVDKVVFTGSARTGQKILHACAEHLVPATMELSGSDAMFVRADADVPLAARALHFGLRLNRGATCIAPRRVFVHESRAAEFEAECLNCFAEGPTWVVGADEKLDARKEGVASSLTPALSRWERENGTQPHRNRVRSTQPTLPDCLPLPAGEGRGEGNDVTNAQAAFRADSAHPNLAQLIIEAAAQGARVLVGEVDHHGRTTLPLLITDAAPHMRLLREDHFSSVAAIVRVRGDAAALAANDECPYALGASVFSVDEAGARTFAARVNAGGVVINDVIVPTADPRLPFGGRKHSGFGVTRGAEGLIELTVPKVITTRRGSWRPHHDAPRVDDAELFSQFLSFTHAPDWGAKLKAALALARAALNRRKS